MLDGKNKTCKFSILRTELWTVQSLINYIINFFCLLYKILLALNTQFLKMLFVIRDFFLFADSVSSSTTAILWTSPLTPLCAHRHQDFPVSFIRSNAANLLAIFFLFLKQFNKMSSATPPNSLVTKHSFSVLSYLPES